MSTPQPPITSIDRLLAAFNDQTLDAPSWTHEAHLTVGLMHAREYALHDAICRMRGGIILLNGKHQTPNTGQRGYHETLTVFWMTVLSLYVNRFPAMSKTELVNSFLQSPLADRSLPFLFYEKEKVLSEPCRAMYISPEKMPLNEEVIESLLSVNTKGIRN